MNKKHLTTFLVLGLAFAISACSSEKKSEVKNVYHVDFFNNYLRQDFIIAEGYGARGNNVVYKTVEVEPDNLVAKPEDPTRKNFEFKGWFKEEKCENSWNFESEKVTKDTRLFAKWGLSESGDIVEPTYTPPSTVLPDSEANDYVINSIMNFKIETNTLKVTTGALTRLEANKTNILPLMEYKVKAGKTFTATYDANVITVTCNGSVQNINVVDDSATYQITNEDDKDNYATYETKAKKYEAKIADEESENYHVMLAGSSSIEFWSNSKTDLAPIVSYNHGIGGTTIEQWENKLNQRLVFPNKPKMVVYYVGINNIINRKENTTTVYNRLVSFFESTHAALPDTKIQYILMNFLPDYNSNYNSTIDAVNKKAIEYQASHDWLTLINPGEALKKENGEADASFFRSDCVHLSEYGYIIWGGIIKEAIVTGLEAMSN